MTKTAKSQLELYMEELDQTDSEEPLHILSEETELAGFGDVQNAPVKSSWFSLGLKIVHFLLVGILTDSVLVMDMLGVCRCGVLSTKTSENNTHFQSQFTAPRRMVQAMLVTSLLRLLLFNNFTAPVYIVGSIIENVSFWLFCIMVLFPMVFGIVTLGLKNRIQTQFQYANRTTECIISVVKRVQLVHMGGNLSHPMPPVAKLEESFLRSQAGADMHNAVSCVGIRAQLYTALTHLEYKLGRSSNISKMASMVTIAKLEHLSSNVFLLGNKSFIDQQQNLISCAINQLHSTYFQRSGKSSTSLESPHLSWSHHGGPQCDFLALCGDYSRCLAAIMGVPFQQCALLLEINLYLKTCRSVCGGLTDAVRRSSVDVPAGSEEQRSSPHSFSDTYLQTRLKLARLRASYEDMNIRLWQAEQQLASAASLQLLLSDEALLTGKLCSKEGAASRAEAIHHALKSLSGSGSESGEDPTESIELLLAGLPVLRDFELLCEDLQLLRVATLTGSTPAQQRSKVVDNPSPCRVDYAASARATSIGVPSATGAALNTVRTAPSVYEDGRVVAETPVLVLSALDTSVASNGILDVYTTTVPRRSAPQARGTIPTVDEAAAARERAQARLILRELNQHLRRKRTPAIEPSSPSSWTQSGDSLVAPSVLVKHTIPCYAFERVRHISSREGHQPSVDEIEGELKIETNIVSKEDSADESSDDDDCDKEAPSEKRTEPSVLVGTMHLTAAELQDFNRQDTYQLAPGVQSFQDNMRQALREMQLSSLHAKDSTTQPASVFAMALRTKTQVEDTFGDELSD